MALSLYASCKLSKKEDSVKVIAELAEADQLRSGPADILVQGSGLCLRRTAAAVAAVLSMTTRARW